MVVLVVRIWARYNKFQDRTRKRLALEIEDRGATV